MNKSYTKITACALVAAASLGSASLALAEQSPLDLTGTWKGMITCERLNDGVLERTRAPSDAEITQFEDGFLAIALSDEHDDYSYNGYVDYFDRRPRFGRATIIECESDPTDEDYFGEMANWKAFASDGLGVIMGESIYGGGSAPQGTCTWRLVRTSTEDPGITLCGAP